MKTKSIAVLLAVVAATLIAVFLNDPSENVATRTICVIAPARGDFLSTIQSEPRYSLLRADPIGKSGRVRVTATGTTKELAQRNLDALILSLVTWGYDWQVKGISKEELAVVNVAGAVQDYDPRDQPGGIWRSFKQACVRLRDAVVP